MLWLPSAKTYDLTRFYTHLKNVYFLKGLIRKGARTAMLCTIQGRESLNLLTDFSRIYSKLVISEAIALLEIVSELK